MRISSKPCTRSDRRSDHVRREPLPCGARPGSQRLAHRAGDRALTPVEPMTTADRRPASPLRDLVDALDIVAELWSAGHGGDATRPEQAAALRARFARAAAELEATLARPLDVGALVRTLD